MSERDARYYNFFREGVAELATRVREALVLARWRVTSEAVLEVVDSLPFAPGDLISDSWREKPCNRALLDAHLCCAGTSDRDRMMRNKRYFIEEFPDKDWEAKAMMVAAFRGVLSIGVDNTFDPETLDRMRVVDEIRDAVRRELADHAKRPGFFAGIRKAVGL